MRWRTMCDSTTKQDWSPFKMLSGKTLAFPLKLLGSSCLKKLTATHQPACCPLFGILVASVLPIPIPAHHFTIIIPIQKVFERYVDRSSYTVYWHFNFTTTFLHSNKMQYYSVQILRHSIQSSSHQFTFHCCITASLSQY